MNTFDPNGLYIAAGDQVIHYDKQIVIYHDDKSITVIPINRGDL